MWVLLLRCRRDTFLACKLAHLKLIWCQLSSFSKVPEMREEKEVHKGICEQFDISNCRGKIFLEIAL
ncbi:hypothetical protein CKAN_02672100 [Cinnamomum micranthum f. kanehirae]|uniref:Uncharacterized protein n=1 Tax=Cinnamomum micranthum f. kanehirae TaxID=337451 RepID=A0A443Q2Q2_9MAGN|nr:hypothetical protein CKAN_02672100 [Cinnamomum micranthum f. kanehirae]